MPKETIDTFSYQIHNYGKFVKSTCAPLSMKKKKQLITATLQLTFGINQKKDNQIKTKQITLF